MSTLSQYIGDTDINARFRVRQLRVAVLLLLLVLYDYCVLQPALLPMPPAQLRFMTTATDVS